MTNELDAAAAKAVAAMGAGTSEGEGGDPPLLCYRKASSYLLKQLHILQRSRSTPHKPLIGIICGSGLSGLSSSMTSTASFPYGDIPGFPPSVAGGVEGHRHEVIFGNLCGTPTVCFRGRFHYYEGHDMNTVALPVRIMRCLGVKLVIVTNASGGLNPSYDVGDIVCIMDHVALPLLGGENPLRGINDPEMGPRFPPTSNMYSGHMQNLVVKCAKKIGLLDKVKTDGTYCFVGGPSYESRSECRFLRGLGGDCVGMSTVPELIAAHHAGMRLLCLSVVTNKVVIEGNEGDHASHEEVLDSVDKASKDVRGLVEELVRAATLDFLAQLEEMPPITLDLDLKKAAARCVAAAADGAGGGDDRGVANSAGAGGGKLPKLIFLAAALSVGAMLFTSAGKRK